MNGINTRKKSIHVIYTHIYTIKIHIHALIYYLDFVLIGSRNNLFIIPAITYQKSEHVQKQQQRGIIPTTQQEIK